MTEKMLKPCPFCGSVAVVRQTINGAWYAMCCQVDCITFNLDWSTETEARDAWNSRAPDPEAAAEIRRLRAEVEGVRGALFEPISHDASLNLQGALDDLRNRYKPNDGGVCARTVERVIGQLEQARAALGRISGEE